MPDDIQSLPFLTRKMLEFEHATTFSLRINSYSDKAGKITIRGVTREGIFNFSHIVDDTGRQKIETFQLPDIPIMVSAIDRIGELTQGQCYASLSLLINQEVVMELASGYVYRSRGITYPVARGPDSWPNRGNIRSRESANPPPGGDIFQLYSTSKPLYIKTIAVRFRLVTDATVVDRRVHLIFDNATSTQIECIANQTQGASQARNYTAAAYPSLPIDADDDDILIPIPPNIVLEEDSIVQTDTTNLQAGDNFGTMRVMGEEFRKLTPL